MCVVHVSQVSRATVCVAPHSSSLLKLCARHSSQRLGVNVRLVREENLKTTGTYLCTEVHSAARTQAIQPAVLLVGEDR